MIPPPPQRMVQGYPPSGDSPEIPPPLRGWSWVPAAMRGVIKPPPGFALKRGVKRYPEPHDHGGIYNRSPCACYHLPFAGILLFHANLPRNAFGRRFGNLTLTTDVGKTCLCERSGHFSYQGPHRQPMRRPLRFTHQNIRNQQGFFFHIVSVNFHASVLIINVLTAGGWLATLAQPPV